MRDIYDAHLKFWNVALLPCIQQVVQDPSVYIQYGDTVVCVGGQ